jgi:phosphotriesterase-related protein
LEAGATIGSHTIRGRVVRDQLDILDEIGFPLQRFIWIHAHVEEDFELNLEMARRGVWIEYDNLGWEPEEDGKVVERVQKMIAAGLGGRVLLSHDMGWYDPAQPGGGIPQPFTYLSNTFIPRLRAAGVSAADLHLVTVENPFTAFARI